MALLPLSNTLGEEKRLMILGGVRSEMTNKSKRLTVFQTNEKDLEILIVVTRQGRMTEPIIVNSSCLLMLEKYINLLFVACAC